jgi:hypothetical protein
MAAVVGSASRIEKKAEKDLPWEGGAAGLW